jgi:hypothetical protein
MSITMAILLLLLDTNRSIYRFPWDIWLFPLLIQPSG